MTLEKSIHNIDGDNIPEPEDFSDQFMIFQSGENLFAIKLVELKNVIPKKNITQVPGSPPHYLGVMSVRGTIIPVLNFEYVIQEKVCTQTGEFLLILKDSQESVGIIIHRILAVTEIAPEDFEPLQPNTREKPTNYYAGIFKFGTRSGRVLNMENILNNIPGSTDE